MHLLGNILKQAVNLAGTLREDSDISPVESQTHTLRELIAKAAGTKFGRDHHFAELMRINS